MTLDSGMDKKVSGYRGEGGYAGAVGAEAPGEPMLDVERFSVDSEMGYPNAAPAPSGGMTPARDTAIEGSGNVISEALAGAGISEELIDNWVLPKAYAQDHGEDEQYLVRSGDVSLEIDDYEEAQDKIAAIAGKYSGFVSDSQSQRYGDERIEGWVSIRVPAEKFFDAWEDVRALGTIDSERITTENVSREYLANHSQMKNLLAQQATLTDMLKEAIEVQRKHGLGEEDRQNALADQITKSTITAHLVEVRDVSEVVGGTKDQWNWGTNRAFDDATRELRSRLKNLWNGLIWFVVTCWTWLIPLLFWVAVLWFIYRKWIRPRLVKLAAEQAKPAASTADGGEVLADKQPPKPEE